jgi:hypothetical protein
LHERRMRRSMRLAQWAGRSSGQAPRRACA